MKDFEEGVQTLDRAITDMSTWSLNYWLSKLVQSKQLYRGALYVPFVVLNYLRTEAHLSDVSLSAVLNVNPLDMSDRR